MKQEVVQWPSLPEGVRVTAVNGANTKALTRVALAYWLFAITGIIR